MQLVYISSHQIDIFPVTKPNPLQISCRRQISEFQTIYMAATRLLRLPRPPGLGHDPSNSLSGSCKFSPFLSRSVNLRCFCKGDFGTESRPSGHGEKKVTELKASVLTSDCVITSEPKSDRGFDLALLFAYVRDVLLQRLNVVKKTRPWKMNAQTIIEKAIIDCRFFTFFAVAGSLVGSILCFVDGCFLILESYFQYFHVLSQGSEQGHLMHLLIEAIGMFLLAIVMLVFGMGLYVLFVGSYNSRSKVSGLPQSNYLKNLPSWAGMRSIVQAKSKIGQVVIMMLQLGVLEKFKSIPLVTGFDLACFAGVVFVSSASTFLLSKLTIGGNVI